MVDGLNVLIVDDSADIRFELRDKFEAIGQNVIGECSNGLEAIELVKQLQPDLVSLDIIMPVMDGIECYRILRSLPNPPRVILISALAAEPKVLKAYEAEIYTDHFLSKPVELEELMARIEGIFSLPALPLPMAIEGSNRQSDDRSSEE